LEANPEALEQSGQYLAGSKKLLQGAEADEAYDSLQQKLDQLCSKALSCQESHNLYNKVNEQ